jgi:GTP-binding protein EngB required for normal cell division
MERIEKAQKSDKVPVAEVINLANELAARYEISSTRALIQSLTVLSADNALDVAVVGRFKAGKSSFLNHFLGHKLLPVGVVPVTTVVTTISFGPEEKATVHFLSGETREISVVDVDSFVAESENPNNFKDVLSVSIELPELMSMQSLRFVDLPGLESALAHNTQAVVNWLPNVGLALVAISVDPPLSQQDIELLRSVRQYTPHVAILLTKIDLVSDNELQEVTNFIFDRLKRVFGCTFDLYPYSVRPGFESHKNRIERELIGQTLARFEERHTTLLWHKVETVLRETRDYLTFASTAAELAGTERETLRAKLATEKQELGMVKSELRLIVQHAKNRLRDVLAKILNAQYAEVSARLLAGLQRDFPTWTRSLAFTLSSYERWLADSLAKELMIVSQDQRQLLVEPLEHVKNQIFRRLQNFREQFSDKTEQLFGIPLRTTETEIRVSEPQVPDVRVGRVFDRNWELLSPLAPMMLITPIVARHFKNKLPYIVEKNFSRLTSQWSESLSEAMTATLKEAERRLDELVETVERLLATSPDTMPKIQNDIQLIDYRLETFDRSGTPL